MASGRASRYTADDIRRVRELHERWAAVRRERAHLMAELRLRPYEFTRYGRGVMGKKPRAA